MQLTFGKMELTPELGYKAASQTVTRPDGEVYARIYRVMTYREGDALIVRGYRAEVVGHASLTFAPDAYGTARKALSAARGYVRGTAARSVYDLTDTQREDFLDALDSVLYDAGTNAVSVFGRQHAATLASDRHLPSATTLIRYMLPLGLSVAEVWRRFEAMQR